jgi:hypothetical protein
MANEINIGINTTSDLSGLNKVDESVKSLKTQLKEAQANVAALSDTFGATSKQAVEAAKAAASLKDRIGDAKALTDAFNPDAKFKAVSSSLVGVAGGFSAVTGAMGIFGEKSKDVEQAVLKVQSAMALASGVQAIGESIDSFKQLGAVIKSTTIFQRIATAAQWLWNAAMAANPVGAVIVAISGLITAGYLLIKMFETSKPKIDLAAESLKRHTKETENNNEAIKKSIEKKKQDEEYQYRLMKAQGIGEITILKTAVANAKATQSIANKNYQTAHEIALAEYLEIIERKKLAAQLEAELQQTKSQGGWTLNVDARIEKNKEELKSIQDKYNVDNKTNKLRVDDVINANAEVVKANQNLTIALTQIETDKNKTTVENKKEVVKTIDKIDTTKKDKDEQRVNQAKTLLEKATKEQEDLLADTNVKQENLLNERNKKEYEKIELQKDRIAALELEAANHIKRLEQAVAKDKEIQDQKDEAARVKKRQDIEDDNEVKLNAIRQEKNDNLDQQREYAAHLNTLYESQKASGVVSVELEKEIAEQKKLIAKTEQEYKEYSINKGIEVAGQAGQLLQQIAGNSKEAAIGGIVLEKAASIASIIASTFATNAKFTGHPASILSFGGAAALPVALNTASGAIGIASIIAQASKSIAEINNTKSDAESPGKTTPSKFATGGLVTGMGTSTSDSIMANLSNGESVINAKSTAMFGNLLSNINQAGGGVGFGTQSQANPIFKTYVVASEMTSQIEANLKLKQIARL